MIKNLSLLALACLLFSALFSVGEQPIVVEPMQYVQTTPYRMANVLFSDGSFHEVEMKRPMFMSGSCQRSTKDAIKGEIWVSVDGPTYIYEGNNVWTPRREETRPPVKEEVVDTPIEKETSILDNVVIEPYNGQTNECVSCNNYSTRNYVTYSYGNSYRRGGVFQRRTAIFPRLRTFFSRFRFRW
jgi:hypothetical protein